MISESQLQGWSQSAMSGRLHSSFSLPDSRYSRDASGHLKGVRLVRFIPKPADGDNFHAWERKPSGHRSGT